jgi:hypothetical protein
MVNLLGISAEQRVFELRPLISEGFGGQQCTQSADPSSTKLACTRRNPPVSEEFRIPPDTQALQIVGRTFGRLHGSYAVSR